MSQIQIAIFEGGVAGMSAAHELLHEDLELKVYEKKSHQGRGKKKEPRCTRIRYSGISGLDLLYQVKQKCSSSTCCDNNQCLWR